MREDERYVKMFLCVCVSFATDRKKLSCVCVCWSEMLYIQQQ